MTVTFPGASNASAQAPRFQYGWWAPIWKYSRVSPGMVNVLDSWIGRKLVYDHQAINVAGQNGDRFGGQLKYDTWPPMVLLSARPSAMRKAACWEPWALRRVAPCHPRKMDAKDCWFCFVVFACLAIRILDGGCLSFARESLPQTVEQLVAQLQIQFPCSWDSWTVGKKTWAYVNYQHTDDMLKSVQASAMMEFAQLLGTKGELSKRPDLGDRKQKRNRVEGAIFGHSCMVCFSIEAIVILVPNLNLVQANMPCVPCWNCCIGARTGLRCCLWVPPTPFLLCGSSGGSTVPGIPRFEERLKRLLQFKRLAANLRYIINHHDISWYICYSKHLGEWWLPTRPCFHREIWLDRIHGPV